MKIWLIYNLGKAFWINIQSWMSVIPEKQPSIYVINQNLLLATVEHVLNIALYYYFLQLWF